MLNISYSRASVARGCWQKYKFRYIDGLEPTVKSTALSLGRIIHEAFNEFYNGLSDDDCLKFVASSFDKEIGKVELPDQEALVIAKYTGLGMWKNYPHKQLGFDKIFPEEKFEVRLGNKLRGIKFIGKVDGRILKDDVWWVREVKVTGLSQRQFAGRIGTSGQGTGYVYALKKKGYDVQGLMYDCIKKPLLHKGIYESVHDFGIRIYKDYADPKKKAMYYQRHYTYRNQDDLQLFQEGMETLAREIRQKERTGGFYRNPDQCWNYNSECPYHKICKTAIPDKLTTQLFFTTREDRKKEGGQC